MAMIDGGHLVAKYLKEIEGVNTVFSLSGGHIDRIYDGFLEYGVRLVDVRHEQAAAMMAHAWSMYADQPGVCLVTAGPGFTNALTGIVNAAMENIPMVVICGTAPVRDWQKGALQEIGQADMIKQSVKWHAICHDPARIPEYLHSAFRHAVNGRPGPVFLELPPDVLNVKVDDAAAVMPGKGAAMYRSASDPEAVKRAAEIINNAQNPLILGGSGIALSDCGAELQQFIKTTGIPHILLASGRGYAPEDDGLSLWPGGLVGVLAASSMADVVIALGVRFNWLLMFGQGFPQAKVVRVDIDAAEMDRNCQVEVGMSGDLKMTLGQLNELVDKRDHTAWSQTISAVYTEAIAGEIAARDAVSSPIHPQRMVELVRQAAGDDCIYIGDGGDTCYFAMVGLKATGPSGVYGAAGGQFGCLGTGIPMGIAAKAAQPDKNVVVISGDGSTGLNLMEIDTAVRHNIPITCVVNNDQAWGMIKHGQEVCYGDDRVFGSSLGVVRYDLVAQGLGGHGEFVEKDEDVIPAIKRAMASGKPAVVNIMTDPCVTSLATYNFVEGLKMED